MNSMRMKLMLMITAQCLLAQAALAQGSANRAQTFEMAVQLPYQDSQRFSGEEGTGARIDGQLGFGAAFTYHLSDHLAISGDFSWISPSYEATYRIDDDDNPSSPDGELVTIRHRADMFTGQARATWHFLDGPVTPFVEGALGFTYADSNVASGPPTSGCWWDPLWGYICRPFWSTYDDTGWSYGYGGGVRWDMNRDYGMRFTYHRRIVDLRGSSDPEFDLWQFEFLLKF